MNITKSKYYSNLLSIIIYSILNDSSLIIDITHYNIINHNKYIKNNFIMNQLISFETNEHG